VITVTESRPDSTTEILRHVLRTALPLVRADLGGIFIFDESFARVVTGAIEGVQPPGSLPPVAVAGLPPATVPVERWLRANRRPLHLFRPSDWRRFPPVNPGLRALAAAGHLVGLAVPLLWDDTLVGVAYFWRHREPVPFARREIQEVVRWCRLVSSVAISTRLLTSEAALRADLEQLLALSRTLEEATSFSALGHAVYAALAQILAPASLLLVLRTEPEPLILSSVEIPATPGTRLRAALAHWEELSRSDRKVYWFSREQARRELGDWIEELPGAVRELLFAPLDGPIPGSVLAWNDDALSQLRERKESVLSILLGQTSAAAARLANQLALERTIDQLRALLSVAESVAATESIAGLLERVEQALRTRLRYDALIFLEPDPDTPAMLRVTWGSGTYPEAAVGNTIPLEHSLAGYVYRTGRALAVPDTWSDPRTYHRPDRRFPLRSLVLYPIQTEERTVAVLGFGRTALDPFSETDQHLGSLVAHELSLALVVVTQREALRTHARAQALLADLSQLLLRESDPRRFAQPSVERLAAWSGSDVALVLRCPLDRGTVVAAAGAHRTSLERQLLMLADPACIRWLAAAAANGPLVFPTSDTAPEAFRQPIADLIRGLGPLLVLPLTPAGLPSGLLVCSVPPQFPAQRQTMLDTLRRAGERLREALESWISDLEREFATRLAYELAAAGDEQAFAARLLDVVTPLFVCDFGAVLRADNERHLWYPLAVTARGQENSPRWHLGFDELASLGAAAECQVSNRFRNRSLAAGSAAPSTRRRPTDLPARGTCLHSGQPGCRRPPRSRRHRRVQPRRPATSQRVSGEGDIRLAVAAGA